MTQPTHAPFDDFTVDGVYFDHRPGRGFWKVHWPPPNDDGGRMYPPDDDQPYWLGMDGPLVRRIEEPTRDACVARLVVRDWNPDPQFCPCASCPAQLADSDGAATPLSQAAADRAFGTDRCHRDTCAMLARTGWNP